MTNNKARLALIISASIGLGVPLGLGATAALAAGSSQSYEVRSSATLAPIVRDDITAVEESPEAFLPPCELEDSDDCIWDAGEAGNNEGHSFIAWHGQVYYLDPTMGE